MSEPRVSPDERITMNALNSPDPFARPGAPAPVVRPIAPTGPRALSKNWDAPIVVPGSTAPAPTQVPAPVAPEPSAPEPPKRAPLKKLVSLRRPSEDDRYAAAPEKPPVEKTLEEVLPVAQMINIPDEPKKSNPIIESRSPAGLPSYRCEFEGRDIFVGFPVYKATNPVTAFTLIAMALDFGRDKIRYDMAIGDSKIEHARNRLAHKFLETDAKWMLMIDDDIIPSIGRPGWYRECVQGARNLPDLPLSRHVLHRLMGAGQSLVGASYFGRQEGGALMASDQSLFSRAKAYEDRVVPVDWVGTGCILIHRKVFESIRSHFGDSLRIDVPDYEYDYFRPFDSANGEDVSFCRRAKEAGHQPHLDLGLPVFHVGFKTF